MLPLGRLLRALPRPGTPRFGPARRGVISGPPESPLGPGESVVGLVAMGAACLGPAAWVLAHLEDYKKRE